jgi:hypothetical protein
VIPTPKGAKTAIPLLSSGLERKACLSFSPSALEFHQISLRSWALPPVGNRTLPRSQYSNFMLLLYLFFPALSNNYHGFFISRIAAVRPRNTMDGAYKFFENRRLVLAKQNMLVYNGDKL